MTTVVVVGLMVATVGAAGPHQLEAAPGLAGLAEATVRLDAAADPDTLVGEALRAWPEHTTGAVLQYAGGRGGKDARR